MQRKKADAVGNTKSLRLILTGLFMTVLQPLAGYAGEQGHYVPGSWSPRDFISAPTNTTVLAPYFSLYHADVARTGTGKKIDSGTGVDVSADSWMFTPVIVYAPPVSVLGAAWSATLVPSYGEASANARLTANELGITLFDNNRTGVGDLYAVPANLSWMLNNYWTISAQYAFWAPVGLYDPDRADNVGLGYWSHDFRGTVSLFPFGNQGLLLSASVMHEINSKKEGFDLTPAPHTTVELGASMFFTERFSCGVLLGGIWETGDASGSDVFEDGRDRMFNAGIEAAYWFMPGKLGTMARITQEFDVRDRFEGTTYTAGLNWIL